MKIHKVDKERIYFTMDSGAYGSIKREDVGKLICCNKHLEKEKIDPRNGECLSEKAYNIRMEGEVEELLENRGWKKKNDEIPDWLDNELCGS